MTEDHLEKEKQKAIKAGEIVIEISGGVLVDVYNLPKRKTYVLIDWDNTED